jgi:serine/threonine protein phosphatase PrpC
MIDLDYKYFKEYLETFARNQGSTCLFAIIDAPDLLSCSCYPFFRKKLGYSITVVHLGDSRAILVRGGAKNDDRDDFTIDVLTQDHRTDLTSELERIKNAGGSVGDGRVDGKLNVTRAIGDFAFKNDPKLSVEEQKVIPIPDIIRRGQINEDDFLLIGCDGLFEKLSSESVVHIIRRELKKNNFNDPCKALVTLFDEAVAAGSTDNITASLVMFKSITGYRKPFPEFVLGKVYFEDGLHLQYGFQFAGLFGLEQEYKNAVEQEWKIQNSHLIQNGKSDLPSLGEIWSRIDHKKDDGDGSMSFDSDADFLEEKAFTTTTKQTHQIEPFIESHEASENDQMI